ncbi:LuxR C-terminal-related transcriptional regulator [Aliikangiella sp. IMCC44359]|uniref:LuxR C-terminal-related transcriptional regulator n=1 Tax=Aliikangiella sp. IMCC44359 TaxID=3459125 RepID=UPI00403AA18A
MKILLIDDHDMFRDGISMLLSREYPDIQILQAKDLSEALEHLEKHSDFSMVLLDLHLQDSSPHENIKSIISRYPKAPVSIISGEERPEFIRNIMEYKINAYIPKTIGNDEFVRAIKKVLSGKSYLPPMVEEEIRRYEEDGSPLINKLTQRQIQVLALLAEGVSNQQIAEKLNISGNTITVHVKSILKTLNAANRTEAGFLARKYGII